MVHTGINRKRIVIRAQAEKQEERREPYTNSKERSDISEVGYGVRKGRSTIRSMGSMPYFLGELCEVKEPEEVIQYDKDTRGNETERGQGDERPAWGEILEVDDVAEHRE